MKFNVLKHRSNDRPKSWLFMRVVFCISSIVDGVDCEGSIDGWNVVVYSIDTAVRGRDST